MLPMSCHVLPAEEIPLEMFALMRIVPGGIDRALSDLCEWWEHRNDEVQRLNQMVEQPRCEWFRKSIELAW